MTESKEFVDYCPSIKPQD